MLAPNRRTDVNRAAAARASTGGSRPGVPVFRASFPAIVGSIPQARRFLAQAMEPRVDADALDVTLLLGSELVTNAVVHAATPFAVSVEVGDERLRVAVEDGDDRPPRVADRDATTRGGFGLLLVDELASGWGVQHARRGESGDDDRADDDRADDDRADDDRAGGPGRKGRRPGKTVWFEVELER